MIRIYHNARCGKSRCALQVLEQTHQEFQVVEYLKTPPSEDELRQLLRLLGKRPLEIIRQKEEIFQTDYAGKIFSDEEWIRILAEHPILIERPIIVAGDKAWIARDEAGWAEIGRLTGKS